MYPWLTSMNKKKHQRAINRAVRGFNKQLEQDNLWLGRFIVRQYEDSPQWCRYEDGSGAELYVPALARLSYGGEILAVAAGPACNLLLWALLSSVGGEALAPFAGAHLILGALNLLPVRPMDGGRLLWLLVSLCSEPYTADRVAYITGAAVSSALLLVCLYLTLTTGGGLFLLPGVLWLTVNGVLPNGTKHDKISRYNK